MKNQIEIIQNGIVKIDNEAYIFPVKKITSNSKFDENTPKIKHLNSLNYEEYNVFKTNSIETNEPIIEYNNDDRVVLENTENTQLTEIIEETNSQNESQLENDSNQNDSKNENNLIDTNE